MDLLVQPDLGDVTPQHRRRVRRAGGDVRPESGSLALALGHRHGVRAVQDAAYARTGRRRVRGQAGHTLVRDDQRQRVAAFVRISLAHQAAHVEQLLVEVAARQQRRHRTGLDVHIAAGAERMDAAARVGLAHHRGALAAAGRRVEAYDVAGDQRDDAGSIAAHRDGRRIHRSGARHRSGESSQERHHAHRAPTPKESHQESVQSTTTSRVTVLRTNRRQQSLRTTDTGHGRSWPRRWAAGQRTSRLRRDACRPAWNRVRAPSASSSAASRRPSVRTPMPSSRAMASSFIPVPSRSSSS